MLSFILLVLGWSAFVVGTLALLLPRLHRAARRYPPLPERRSSTQPRRQWRDRSGEGYDRRSGFTLVELMVVVVILGLLAMMALPKLTDSKRRALVVAMKADLRNLVTAQESYFSDSGSYATTADLIAQGRYNTSSGNFVNSTLTPGGWTAETFRVFPPFVQEHCYLFIGDTPLAPATVEGRVVCEVP